MRYGLSLVILFTKTFLEPERIEADESSGIFGTIITFVVVHGSNAFVIEGKVRFPAYSSDVALV